MKGILLGLFALPVVILLAPLIFAVGIAGLYAIAYAMGMSPVDWHAIQSRG
ncbi:MAG: hypothetical protein IAE97_03100 [Chthoniobacterales bacterium]|nr:hypothetical protein [Chthoniobacterales bacterium]